MKMQRCNWIMSGKDAFLRSNIAAYAICMLFLMASHVCAADSTISLKTRGISLGLNSADGRISSLAMYGKQYSIPGKAGGIYVEDVASGTGLVPVEGMVKRTGSGAAQTCDVDQLGLTISSTYRKFTDHIATTIKVKDLTGSDRAIRLYYRIPLKSSNWIWDDNIIRSRNATSTGVYENKQKFFWDPNGEIYPCERYISTYPFACLRDKDIAISLGVPLNLPRIFGIQYVKDKSAGYLQVSYDLGISADVAKYPSESFVRFVIYAPKKPECGFRSALEDYYSIYPDCFKKRVKREGIWLLAIDPEAIVAPWDFGFGFDETSLSNDRRPGMKYADLFGYDTCGYTEPWGMWLGFRGFDNSKRALRPCQAGVNHSDLKAQVLANATDEFDSLYEKSAVYDEDGNWELINWTDEYTSIGPRAAHLKLAMDPDIPGGYGGFIISKTKEDLENFRKDGIKADGIYLDSLSAYVGFYPENYRREHWKYIDQPLVFNTNTNKVAQLHAFSNWSFVEKLSNYLHSHDMTLIGNIYPPVEKFFYPFLDMVGVESDGGMSGCSADFYAYLRSFASEKPVSWLDYRLIKTALDSPEADARIAKGFERCLSWGVYPGTAEFTAKYIKNVEKRRPLYKKYIPLIKELSIAGWRPMPYAKLSTRNWNVERFGDFHKSGHVYFTVYNPTDSAVTNSALLLDAASLSLGNKRTGITAFDMKSGKQLKIAITGNMWRIKLPEIGSEKTVSVRIATDKACRLLKQDLIRERIHRIIQTMQWLRAYPQGADDSSKNAVSKGVEEFTRDAATLRLVKCIEAKGFNRDGIRNSLPPVISKLRRFPADRYREAMLEQADAALRETDDL